LKRWAAWPYGFGAVWLAVLACATTPIEAAQLRCHIEVNGETTLYVVEPTQDPYGAQSLDIAERFRFKAVVLGQGDEIELVNIYVYYQTRRQPMVLQHAKHLKPLALQSPDSGALTGRVALYSPVLGKELAYQCALHKEAP
jgi:hypothetical protein